MKTFVATKNLGKLAELRAIFAGSPLELETYADYADVEEGERSYRENALLKASALRAQLRDARITAAVLADDSGLEVDALGGRPGVLSARYAGADASWPERRAMLMHELDGSRDRGAQFVCAMALILEDGSELNVLETVRGSIPEAPSGAGGFGYDPLFASGTTGTTFAQLSEEEKNHISHRRRAADALLRALNDRAV
ncbi:MAG: non-canonical purine NTP pyrophosphatase [Candidatus Eremiobacteraeota bacterium]|nr:non-canonical purine NTP pyrophosphatase [Candidatus Eremiobacteraeota bacterium]